MLWDGFTLGPPDEPPVATILIHTRRALWAWLRNPDLNFGEAYMFGDVDVRGDLAALLESVYRAMAEAPAAARGRPGRAPTTNARRARTCTGTTT